MVNFKNKIVDVKDAVEHIDRLRQGKGKVVFTNGCFDLLHLGHISYLEEARNLGDVLVVGLNSDDSVRRLKGEGRPVKNIESRRAVLAGLAAVDVVIVFEEDTPRKLIELVNPDILVKGGDYTIDKIVGADFVLQNNGEVKTIDFVEGYSSSAIINKSLH
ncbi:MAG: D-glycero-beta-D-manno-heptose 1-phosphate adenylyltransferase [Saprospiraceae bacterium]|nr:D-glycero-beta-D-manno-heptose 1-phosphate adenylyltransferase [Saprospiraceae bacterium]